MKAIISKNYPKIFSWNKESLRIILKLKGKIALRRKAAQDRGEASAKLVAKESAIVIL